MISHIEQISPGNEALSFIARRLLSDKYRGSWSSQHNRYDMDKAVKILKLLDKYAPKRSLLPIRTTDISKRPVNTPDEYTYSTFCHDAKKETGIASQDAMRKNIFVDMHRMNLITRYNKNKESIHPLSRSKVKYVALSDLGARLINQDINLLGQHYIFSRALHNMLGGYIDIILNLLRDEEFDLGEKMSLSEFMFFTSAIGTQTSFNINSEKCAELIKAYRSLSPIQERSIIEKLKTTLKPKNYSGNKTMKRDFHNWRNKAQQAYKLLGEAVYFDFRDEYLYLSVDKGGRIPKKLRYRSRAEKDRYFKNHGVVKEKGYELHHVIPLAYANDIHHFKILDNWRNMVYIDGFSHAKITQNGSKNVFMIFDGHDVVLEDFEGSKVTLKKGKNIFYNSDKLNDMLNYNRKLVET